MAIQTLEIIKSWFKTGLKPTQQQFEDTWDSFRHKDEKVSIQDINNIDVLLDKKVDKISGERLISASEIIKLASIEAGAQVNHETDNQIFVNESGAIQDSWHGKIVTFTANSTQTVPASGLRDGFKFDGIVDPTFTINIGITAPKAWHGTYTGKAINENAIFTFIQRKGDINKVSIYGL